MEHMTSKWTIDDLRGKKLLLVASTGGHLSQLFRLSEKIGAADDSIWLTFENSQSRSLLEGRRVVYVPYVRPRDVAGILRASRPVPGLLRQVDGAISTGAAVALSALPLSALAGKPTVYLESVSRVAGPSVTGRLMARLPRVATYTQHHHWASATWLPGPSVLDDYQTHSVSQGSAPVRIFVTLGTIQPYRFDRIVDFALSLRDVIPGVEFVWQLGCTPRQDLPGRVYDYVDQEYFNTMVKWADLTLSHSGVGSAMQILDQGRMPVLMARKHSLGEHIDDHQQQILDKLVERGLAADAESLRGSAQRIGIAEIRVETGLPKLAALGV
jgi:UDP-N-acetylglucosamine--N-acetylmuramyl-(pentapeptide) pyrophosphoryl-undecaprenol N-acetylglucosamine transferase